MTVVGVTMVKDEGDIIETTMLHMMTQVDVIVVADNGSTDRTTEVLTRLQRDFPAVFLLVHDDDPAYYQSRKVTALAQLVRTGRSDATWVVPFDADEVWLAPDGRRVADVLEDQGDDTFVVHADVYDHVCTGEDDRNERNPVRRIRWHTAKPLELPKAALRLTEDLVIRAGNHGGDYDETRPTHGAYLSKDKLAVHHFPYRSPEQFVRKVRNGSRAYAATDLDENTGTHWRSYGRILEEKGPQILVGDVFYRYFYEIDPHQPFSRPLVEWDRWGARTGETSSSTR